MRSFGGLRGSKRAAEYKGKGFLKRKHGGRRITKENSRDIRFGSKDMEATPRSRMVRFGPCLEGTQGAIRLNHQA